MLHRLSLPHPPSLSSPAANILAPWRTLPADLARPPADPPLRHEIHPYGGDSNVGSTPTTATAAQNPGGRWAGSLHLRRWWARSRRRKGDRIRQACAWGGLTRRPHMRGDRIRRWQDFMRRFTRAGLLRRQQLLLDPCRSGSAGVAMRGPDPRPVGLRPFPFLFDFHGGYFTRLKKITINRDLLPR